MLFLVGFRVLIGVDFGGGGVAGAPERHRPAEPAGGAGEAQAQEEAPRPVPQLLLHGTIPSPSGNLWLLCSFCSALFSSCREHHYCVVEQVHVDTYNHNTSVELVDAFIVLSIGIENIVK
jgi:hypothetical protein